MFEENSAFNWATQDMKDFLDKWQEDANQHKSEHYSGNSVRYASVDQAIWHLREADYALDRAMGGNPSQDLMIIQQHLDAAMNELGRG